MAKVDTVIFDCDSEWLDKHDVVVHWHNGRVYFDVQNDDGLRVHASAHSFEVAFASARELVSPKAKR